MTKLNAANAPVADAVRPLSASVLLLTAIIYIITILNMASVGLVIPLMSEMAARLQTSVAQISFSLSLFSLPSAIVAAFFGGAFVDRIGAKRTLLASAGLAFVGVLLIYQAGSLTVLQAGLLFAGIANVGLTTAAPAFFMAAFPQREKIQAMSIWSTYGPSGYAVGLLVAAPFAASGGWPTAFLIVALASLAGIVIAAVLLPNPRVAAPLGQGNSWRQIRLIFGNAPLLRLAIGYAIPTTISYGSSLAAPGYLVKTYGVSMAESATGIAAAKLAAMLIGGALMGWLLARRLSRATLLACLLAIGAAAQFALYFPGSGFEVAVGGMIVWLFSYGAISAVSYVMLSDLTPEPSVRGLAAGFLSQALAVACFAAPPVYFTMQDWRGFAVIGAFGMLAAFVAFPKHVVARSA